MNIFSLSFGKDSMATLILAAEQGIPIDRVMYCDIRFSDEISGEHPLMAEWIPKAEERLEELFGITVDHAYSGTTFAEKFFTVKKKGVHAGDIYGFPFGVGAWCNSRLKLKAISRYIAQFDEATQFVGIAADEPARWAKMVAKQTKKRRYRSLLMEQGITEKQCFEICERYDLLSPLYKTDGIYRGGCWFCPKQCLADLYSLWKNYPAHFMRLVIMEQYSLSSFRPRTTLKELSKRFEDGYIPARRKTRDKYVQTSIFDEVKDESNSNVR